MTVAGPSFPFAPYGRKGRLERGSSWLDYLESHSSKNESGTLEFWFGIPMNTITKKPKTKFGPRVVFSFFVSLAAFRKRSGGKIHGPGIESFFVFFVSVAAFRKRNGGKIHGPGLESFFVFSFQWQHLEKGMAERSTDRFV